MESSSASRRRESKKRSHRYDDDDDDDSGKLEYKSRKRRLGASSSSSATTTFPLTENGVQMIVRGLALVTPEDVKNQKLLVKRNNHPETVNIVSNAGNEKDKLEEIDVPSLREVILKLRIDRKASSLSVLLGTVCDGKESTRVLLADTSGKLSRRIEKEKQRNKIYDWIVSVRGYTTTEAVCNDKFPFTPYTCLTAVSVLSTIKKRGTLGEPFPYSVRGSKRAHAGLTGSFLEQHVSFLTNEEMAGSAKISVNDILGADTRFRSSKSNATTEESAARILFPETSSSDLKTVQDFLSFSTAMDTIQQSSTSSSSAPPEPQSPVQDSVEANMFSPTKLPTHQAADLYSKAVEEFNTSQMDRQNTSLSTNAGKESAENAALIVQRYNTVLALALKETRPLTTEMLCSWHHDLMEGVGDGGGDIRSRTVRCGKTVFCPPARVRSELDMFCNGLQALKKRLDFSNALHMVLYAVVAMYGVIDIHPFLDGNGRVSRIVANYALKRLPFPVNLFATPAQRAEYIMAIEQTRHSLSIRARGDVSAGERLHCYKHAGVFQSLVTLLMERIAKAAVECNKVWEEKSGLFAEAAEARAARKHRERSAQGMCIICFDALPNICTLCCGKPIHLNCIAEWLGMSSNTTCPNCRSPMPAISRRVARAARRSADDEHTEADNASEALEVARQNIEDIRETRDLLARIYDQVSQRGIRRDVGSSEDSFSSPSDVGDTTTRTTSDEDSSDDSEEIGDGETRLNYFQEAHRRSSPGDANRFEDTTITSSDSDDDIAQDTTTTIDGDNGDRQDHGGDTTTTTTEIVIEGGREDTTSSSPGGSSRRSLTFCSGHLCNNRAAVDCTNNLCGRCCVLSGEFHCSRHNS
jgi:fido (protein-threonine AMPylation protein)